METGLKATSEALAAAFAHYKRMTEHMRLEIEAPMRALRTIAEPLQRVHDACRAVVGAMPIRPSGDGGRSRP